MNYIFTVRFGVDGPELDDFINATEMQAEFVAAKLEDRQHAERFGYPNA